MFFRTKSQTLGVPVGSSVSSSIFCPLLHTPQTLSPHFRKLTILVQVLILCILLQTLHLSIKIIFHPNTTIVLGLGLYPTLFCGLVQCIDDLVSLFQKGPIDVRIFPLNGMKILLALGLWACRFGLKLFESIHLVLYCQRLSIKSSSKE